MSKTYKDRNKRRRIVNNKKIQALSNYWHDDFYHKNKSSKMMIREKIRNKRKEEAEKEIKEYLG